MNEKRFYEILSETIENAPKTAGIGTLSEKMLHAVLKHTYAPADSHTEIKLGRFVADVFDGERVIEIQTASFCNLERKLDAFLPPVPCDRGLPDAAPALPDLDRPRDRRGVRSA